MKRILVAILFACTSAGLAQAQTATAPSSGAASASSQSAGPVKNPVTTVLRTLQTRQQKNILGAIDAMPADKYSYKPTPDQITFGHLVVHIINSNYAICGNYAGVKPPTDKPADTDPKDKLMPLVKASFEVCTQALAKATDANLGEQITVFGPKPMARGTALIYLASGMADHYGMQAMYLRLNGILPPTAQKDKM